MEFHQVPSNFHQVLMENEEIDGRSSSPGLDMHDMLEDQESHSLDLYERDNIEGSLLGMTESGEDVVQSVDEADTIDSSLLRMTESRKDVVQSDDEADTVDCSQIRMTEYGEDVVQSVDEADKDSSQNSRTDLQSISSSKTEFEGRRSTHIRRLNLNQYYQRKTTFLQAAFIILYTVPRAIEDFVDREYKGGFVQSIRDHKDQLKATLSSEEWELLSQIIGTVITDLQQTHFKMKNCHKVQKKARIGEDIS
ncbi:unnamed protein product [Mytilus edulis]|uniref:Uncharacterized protein n=1 Tax=Mytilus edulis TaxID=6550 RepID=A0A8S3VFF3_MYTED|nr:unnamed protein product [Mytilus edulis]